MPNQRGVPLATLWASTISSTLAECRDQLAPLSSWPTACSPGNQGLPPQQPGQLPFPLRIRALVRQGWPYYECPHSQTDAWAPSQEHFIPWQLGGPSQAGVAGAGARMGCSTVHCSSLLFRVLPGSSLTLAPTAGGASGSFSPPLLCGRCHRTKTTVWAKQAMPLLRNPSCTPLTCLVSSVTALKTNIFAYFAYFTNRECWLLIHSLLVWQWVSLINFNDGFSKVHQQNSLMKMGRLHMICRQVKYSLKAFTLSYSMIKFLGTPIAQHEVHPPSIHTREVLRDGGRRARAVSSECRIQAFFCPVGIMHRNVQKLE